MYIDYVRVYQRSDAPGIGCSPDDYPTEDYINKYESSFHYDFKELTERQPFECIYEPKPYNVEPSWVLFPAQLVIQRLLGSHLILAWFFCFDHSTHCFSMTDMTCSNI
jgi:hypothetical protein